MADEQYRAPSFGDVAHLTQAFLLEFGIAHRQHLVDYHNLGLEMRRHRKSESHIHARRITFDRCIKEAVDLGEGDDLVELAADFRPRHAEDGAVQVDVLAPR